MIERFQGDEGAARLREALLQQQAVEHTEAVADALVAVTTLAEYKPGEDVIVEGASDTGVHFIVAGEVEVLVKGQHVAARAAGTHVGEMAFIDPQAPRSATIRAKQTTVTAVVTEAALLKIANEHPRVWRALARELGARLRQRASLLRPANETPILFLACTVERLGIAQKLQQMLSHANLIVQVWTDDVFEPTHSTLQDLIPMVQKADFGVALMFPDDVTRSRGKQEESPRDNVVLELGMILAVLGTDRCIFVRPMNAKMKAPSDLLGLKPVEFKDGEDESTLAARLGPVATAIREMVKKQGAR